MENNKCHLKQEGKCVLRLWRPCWVCSYKLIQIKGIDDFKDHVNIAVTKSTARRSYIVTCLSLIVSALMLLWRILETFN
jgi:hypothetical protein